MVNRKLQLLEWKTLVTNKFHLIIPEKKLFPLFLLFFYSVTPLDTKYALLNPQLRAEAKRAALGLPPDKTEQQKGKAKPAAVASKEAAKKKPSKDSKEPSKEKPPKSLPEAIRQVKYNLKFVILLSK